MEPARVKEHVRGTNIAEVLLANRPKGPCDLILAQASGAASAIEEGVHYLVGNTESLSTR